MSATRIGGTAAPSGKPLLHALRRQTALLEFALASLLRHRGKAAVLGAVLTLIVFLLASLAFLRSSVRMEAGALLQDAPDIVVQRLVAGRQDLVPQSAVSAAGALPGVARAQGRLWGYYYDASGGANYTVLVPHAAPPADGETAIGSGVSRSRQGYSRDVLAFRSYNGKAVLLTVKAVLPERADLIAADLVAVSERDFRALFALPADVVNDVAVYLSPGADPAAVEQRLLRALPGARVVTRQDMLDTAASFLDWRHGIAGALVVAMAIALIIVSADKPSALGVEEQREIGTLRALGWSSMDVLIAKTYESVAVSMVALLLGMLTAYVHVYPGGAALFAPVLRGWALLAPNLHLVPSLDIPFLAAIAASTIMLPASGTLLAAYRPASGDPDAVIRE
jgi:predicted lysophospholipase L1 biosynthesis ABC-type transport system permease subunit